MRVALGLEYDGSPFAGWQTQPAWAQVATVQDALDAALSQIANQPIVSVCSGRTDTGVHALQQVAHFDTNAHRPLQAWIRGLNSLLPKSIAVRWAMPVPLHFHARHSAFARRYTYVLCSDAIRPALMHLKVGWVHRQLSLAPMQAAASVLIGEHDFSSFRASECQAKSPVRVLNHFTVQQHGRLFIFDVQANGFLHHMVRNMVGALVYVGQGKWSVDGFAQVFAAKNRQLGAPTFWSDGLYFCGAVYPAAFEIPEPISIGMQSMPVLPMIR
jgi:tRNA pseudouridine38-40 synthase